MRDCTNSMAMVAVGLAFAPLAAQGGSVGPVYHETDCKAYVCEIDMDQDGSAEFQAILGPDCPSGCDWTLVASQPGAAVTSMTDKKSGFTTAVPMSWGDNIGEGNFQAVAVIAMLDAGGCVEPNAFCEQDGSRFLGVRFVIDGRGHYGWVRIKNQSMVDHAFEAEPGSLISAGAGYPCIADPVCDGQVDVNDLLLVINSWGPCPASCAADVAPISGNGVVNVDDLLMVINNWG